MLNYQRVYHGIYHVYYTHTMFVIGRDFCALVTAGEEILALDGESVTAMSPESFKVALKRRPLALRPDLGAAGPRVGAIWISGIHHG